MKSRMATPHHHSSQEIPHLERLILAHISTNKDIYVENIYISSLSSKLKAKRKLERPKWRRNLHSLSTTSPLRYGFLLWFILDS